MGAKNDWESVGGGENWRLIRNEGKKKLQFAVFNIDSPYRTGWFFLFAIGWKGISNLITS